MNTTDTAASIFTGAGKPFADWQSTKRHAAHAERARCYRRGLTRR